MCSIRCRSCDQLLYAERVVLNSLRATGNIPGHQDELICHNCGVVGDINMLNNSLSDIISNINIDTNLIRLT